jgi:hypothetical protein
MAFAYQTLAAVRVPAHAPQASMLYAKVLLISGRFELNVGFTPDGQIHRFQINSVPAKRCGGTEA